MNCHVIPISSFRKVKNGIYTLIIADSICEKYQGLRNVPLLQKNHLMLFTNVSPNIHFTTEECLFSLDIVPLSSKNKILDIWTIKPNMKNIGPTPLGTKKVLEGPAGYFKRNGWTIGDSLFFLKF